MKFSISFALLTALSPLVLQAQTTPSTKPAACPVQAARTPTEADRAFAAGDAKGAEALYRRQLAGSPTVSDYAGVVRSLLEQDKLPEALVAAQGAVSALPSSAEAQSLVGDALARAGDVPAASDAYLKAIALDRCSARAHFGMGKLDELVGRHLTAAREIIGTHTLAPADAEITAAFLPYVKPALRAAALRTFLASKPILPAETLASLGTELVLMDQHKTCTAGEAFTAAALDLEPVLFSGTTIRSWGLAVQINGVKMPLLELDSSVSGIVLNPVDAERAGVHPLASAPVSAGGTYTGVADKLRIGNLEYHDCPVRVAPADALAGANSLIGTDFFRDHVVHIDYAGKVLRLSPLPVAPGEAAGGLTDQFVAPEEQDWSPVYVAASRVLIPTLINKKGPFLFMMATGSIRSAVSPAVATSQLAGSKDESLNLRGSAGEFIKVLPHEGGAGVTLTDVRGVRNEIVPVYTLRKLPVYRFTHNEKPDPNTIGFDLSPASHAIGTEVSGLLGFDILHAYLLEINYRDALAHILFDQNRRYDVREGR